MGRRAKSGASIEELLTMSVPLLKRAERESPRTGPGAKPDIPDWFMGVLIMIAVLKRKKSKSAQYRFLTKSENQKLLISLPGVSRFPSRSTYFDRYRRAHELFKAAIRLQGQKAIDEGVVDATDTAIDKSLIESRGPAWHKRDRNKNKVPRGVDQDSTWGYSEHHGWVQGYSYEVVVTSSPHTIVFPLLASADVASAAEAKTCVEKLAELPPETRTASLDSAYDSNALGEQMEYDAHDRRNGRRFLCPENPRNNRRKKTKPGGADATRAKSRERRAERKQYLETAKGQRIYRRRSKTVEPFNSWFKALFELDQRAWHRGLTNNKTQLLAAMFVYQLLVHYNHRKGRPLSRLQALLDIL